MLGISADEWFWGTGWAISAIGLAWALWLVAGESLRQLIRPRRGVARCPGGWKRVLIVPVREGCWYDLARMPAAPDGSIVCPECGRRATRKRQRRARRQWRRGLFALPLVLLGYGVWVTPRVRAHGWPGAIPTAGLVVAMPAIHRVLPPHAEWAKADQRLTAAYEELARRLRGPEMWGWQRTLAIELVPIGEKAWRKDHGLWLLWEHGLDVVRADPCLASLHDAFERERLSPRQTRRLLDRTFAARPERLRALVVTRDAWPTNYPVRVHLGWAPYVLEARSLDSIIRARVKGSNGPWEEFSAGGDHRGIGEPDRWLATGRRDANRAEIEIEIEIWLGLSGDRDWHHGSYLTMDRSNLWRAWSGIARAVAVGGEPAMALAPRTEPNMGRWLADGYLVRLEDGALAFVWPWAPTRHVESDDHYTVAVRLEVLIEERVIASGQAIHPSPYRARETPTAERHLQTATRLRWLDGDRAVPEFVNVRFVGDRNLAWSYRSAKACWSGDITVQMAVSTHAQPGPLWFTEEVPDVTSHSRP